VEGGVGGGEPKKLASFVERQELRTDLMVELSRNWTQNSSSSERVTQGKAEATKSGDPVIARDLVIGEVL
jgi:hypothetical protein